MSLKKKTKKTKKEQSVTLALKPEQDPRGIWRKSLKPGALSPYWLGVTNLNACYKGDRWSLTYCRCLGIKFHSQKSGKKSEELVVKKSLKLDALNLDWLGVIDGSPLYGHFRKQYLKHCTPNFVKTKRCVLSLLEVGQFAKV